MAIEKNVWDQLEDEDDLWYDRFEIYRSLGSIRSIGKTYQVAKREEGAELTGKSPGHNWHEKSNKYRWAERARAWDQVQRDRFRKEEQDISDDKRRTRLSLIGELQGEAFAAIKKADIANLDELQARSHLAQLRLLFIGLLDAERKEFGLEGTPEGATESNLHEDVAKSLSSAWGNKDVVVGDE